MDRSEVFKRYNRILKESETNPIVMLSPRAYGKMILNREHPSKDS